MSAEAWLFTLSCSVTIASWYSYFAAGTPEPARGRLLLLSMFSLGALVATILMWKVFPAL